MKRSKLWFIVASCLLSSNGCTSYFGIPSPAPADSERAIVALTAPEAVSPAYVDSIRKMPMKEIAKKMSVITDSYQGRISEETASQVEVLLSAAFEKNIPDAVNIVVSLEHSFEKCEGSHHCNANWEEQERVTRIKLKLIEIYYNIYGKNRGRYAWDIEKVRSERTEKVLEELKAEIGGYREPLDDEGQRKLVTLAVAALDANIPGVVGILEQFKNVLEDKLRSGSKFQRISLERETEVVREINERLQIQEVRRRWDTTDEKTRAIAVIKHLTETCAEIDIPHPEIHTYLIEYVDLVRSHILRVVKSRSENACARKCLLRIYLAAVYRIDEEALKDIAEADIESGSEELAAIIFTGLTGRCDPQYRPLRSTELLSLGSKLKTARAISQYMNMFHCWSGWSDELRASVHQQIKRFAQHPSDFVAKQARERLGIKNKQ